MQILDILKIILILIIVIVLYTFLFHRETVTYYINQSELDPEFRQKVHKILSNSAWNKWFNLKEINDRSAAIVNIALVPRGELDEYHKKKPQYYPSGKQIRFSFTFQSGYDKPQIAIDAQNWLYGVQESGLTLDQYRQYVINHEFGHALGYGHQTCNAVDVGGICPVMYQATRGCPGDTVCGYQPVEQDMSATLNGYLR